MALVIMNSTVRVQVAFAVKDDAIPNDPGFSDALYFTPEAFAVLAPEQLEAAQLARFNGWKDALAAAAAAPVEEKTEEVILEEIASLEEQRAMLDEVIAARSAELAVSTAKVGVSGVKNGG